MSGNGTVPRTSIPIASAYNRTENLAALCEPVARIVWGKPSSESDKELKWGTRGARVLDRKKGIWFDHEHGNGGGTMDLVPGATKEDRVQWLRDSLLLPNDGSGKRNIVATYNYVDEKGALLFQVVRFDPKDFRQRRPNGSGWEWKLGDTRRVLYRLPELLEAVTSERALVVTEGEKDADRLWAIGIPATCNPGGAGKWRAEYNETLRGADVVVIGDNDEPGRKHVAQVAAALHGVARRLRVFDLARHWPASPTKGGDISDWIIAGGTAEKLWEMIEAAPNWEPVHQPPAFSEEALALEYTKRHGKKLRYVAMWGRWMRWDGTRWQFDGTLCAFDLARQICREAAAECSDRKIANVVASAKTVAAVERLAKADRQHAATVDDWDADTWLLNTPSGVVDLRSGNMRAHQPDDYMTRITGVAPDASCPTPTWHAFLKRVLNGDTALIDFNQRLAGYALTGATSEHMLAFLYGTGANGKTTFLNAITGCAGDYHRTAPIETFTASSTDRHPTDLAGLRGARLVTAIETEEGRRWAESKIKALTGGDRIEARFMRQDFFEYVPQFKLVIAGNHKPGLRSVDEAIRRRFHLVPFTVTIPHEERDRELDAKLRIEWPGILAWMIEGCLEWQRHGLAPPKAVTDATAAYLEAQDAIAAWIDDQCERSPNAWERSAVLFGSWKAWAERSGEPAGDTKQFRDRLEARGIEHKREPGTGPAGYQGLRLQQAENESEAWWK